MTTTSPSDDVDDGLSEPAGEPSRRPPRRRSRWWRIGYPVALVVLVLAIPVLVYAGLRVILDSTDGQLVRRVTDPSAAGYEAVLEPTPTELLVSVDEDGKLDSVAVLALTSDGVGGVLSIPAGTVMPFATGGGVSLRWVYDNQGLQALRDSVGGVLDLTFGDAQVVRSSDWAALVGPVAPVTVNSPDPVPAPDGSLQFPQGSIDLPADQVWPYLSGKGTSESDLNRIVRTQAFLRAWFSQIGAAGAPGVTIPTDAGLGQFLAGLGASQVQFETLPVTPTTRDAEGNEQFTVDRQAAAAAVATIIPFPEGAPGARPRLRVLDGTGQLDNGVGAALVLAAAGAQIDVVGNARSFGATTTQFVYYDGAYETAANELRDALGVGEVVRSEQTNSATDLTVVLGEDYLATADTGAVAAMPSTLDGEDG
jgi:hypothetical protein